MSTTDLNLYKFTPMLGDLEVQKLWGTIILAKDQHEAARLLTEKTDNKLTIWLSDMTMMFKHESSILHMPKV